MTDEADEVDWADRTFMEKAVPALRVHLAEYIASGAQQTRLVGQVFDKAGYLIPKVGPVLGKAIGVLCEHAGKGLAWSADKVRGGYEIEGLPQAMQFLPSMWRRIGNFSERAVEYLTPGNIEDAVATYNRVSGAWSTVAPKYKLPALAPAVA